MDILDSTKFQGHFHMDQMSYRCFGQDHISRIFWHGPDVLWMFWREPNFKDVLGWNKCFMNALDRIKYQWPFGQDQMSFKDRVWYYPQIQASDGGLGTYPLQIRGWGLLYILLVLCFWRILVTLLVNFPAQILHSSIFHFLFPKQTMLSCFCAFVDVFL